MDFKFDWKPFIIDLLMTFTLPTFFLGLVKNSTQYQAWILAAILSSGIQFGMLFLVKFAYSAIQQAPKNFRQTVDIKFEAMKFQNAKILIKMVLALILASIPVSAVAFVGAYVVVSCLFKAICMPHMEKIAAGKE